jgi:GR25 family glycosyltransferase involved in LPS biosynthesis
LKQFEGNGGSEVVREFSAYLIAVDGYPRNTALLNELSTLGIFTSVELIDAVVPSQLDKETLSSERLYTETLLGRDITSVEICIASSHRKCYKKATEISSKLALVLEDDALIDDINRFRISIEEIPITEKPTIWTFYSPNWSIWRNSNKQLKSVIPPAYAACYVINESAMQIATSHQPVGLADWPIWSNKVDFFLIPESGVQNFETMSFAEAERATAKISKHLIKSVLTPKYLAKVSICNRLRHVFYYPLVWKIFLYFSQYRLFSKSSFIVKRG